MRRLLTAGALLLTATVGLLAMQLSGQAQTDQKTLTFEVASVKLNTAGDGRDRGIGMPPGALMVTLF